MLALRKVILLRVEKVAGTENTNVFNPDPYVDRSPENSSRTRGSSSSSLRDHGTQGHCTQGSRCPGGLRRTREKMAVPLSC